MPEFEIEGSLERAIFLITTRTPWFGSSVNFLILPVPSFATAGDSFMLLVLGVFPLVSYASSRIVDTEPKVFSCKRLVVSTAALTFVLEFPA